jgi:RHS repeat-associated protein
MMRTIIGTVLALLTFVPPAAQAQTEQVFYYHTDAIGSVRMITDETGQVVARYDYRPFGDPCGSLCGTPSPPDKRQFVGKERDQETGFDYFGPRYYTNGTGRFTTVDPAAGHLSNPQTFNRYAYAGNNPLRFTDPTGLDFYLQCEGESDTCHDSRIGKYLRSNFQATIVTSASLADPRSGNSASVTPNGVQITTSAGTFGGEFIAGTAAANNIQGSGAFAGFSFDINGNCRNTCLAEGTFHYAGNATQAAAALAAGGGSSILFVDRINSSDVGLHPHTDQYRFANGAHFSVPWNYLFAPTDPDAHAEGFSPYRFASIWNPAATMPVSGPFHVDRSAGPAHWRDAFCYLIGCR